MAAVKVGAGLAVLRSATEAELLFEDGLSIGPSDAAEAIEEHFEVGVGAEEFLDSGEVEDVLEHGDIVGGAVDDFDLERTIGACANGGDVDVRDGS